jgi:hypothetical protein
VPVIFPLQEAKPHPGAAAAVTVTTELCGYTLLVGLAATVPFPFVLRVSVCVAAKRQNEGK